MSFAHAVGGVTWRFADLKELLAKATPLRSGDRYASCTSASGDLRRRLP